MRTIVAGITFCLGFSQASAGEYSCTFSVTQPLAEVKCDFDSNPGSFCSHQFSDTLKSTCWAVPTGGGVDALICFFHDPNMKAQDFTSDGGEFKLELPGFQYGASVKSTMKSDSVRTMYHEGTGEPQYNVICTRK